MLTYYARTNKTFIKSLITELNSHGIESSSILNLQKQRLNYVKFKCNDMEKVYNIMLYSRLIEGLKVEMADNLVAKTEKDFKMKLSNVKFENYLPLKDAINYKMPEIKAYSFRSKLYHEKMIEQILKTKLNKLAYEYNDSPEDKLKINHNEEEMLEKLERRRNLKQLPRIDVIFQNDSFRLLLDLFNKDLHKHGYKERLNWGSLRETYAAALIYESGLLKKFQETNQLLVWDPFCGSGTIIIELFHIAMNLPARSVNMIENEAFTNLPFTNTNMFKTFVEIHKRFSKDRNIDFTSDSPNFDFHLIASDLDAKSVKALVENSTKISLESYKVRNHNSLLHRELDISNFNPNIYHNKLNNCVDSFIGDFEAIGKEIIFNEKTFPNKKFDIFSNIPYGRSYELSDKIQVKNLYRRFGKFLRKYSSRIGDVYILVNKRHDKDELNFKNLTEMKWTVVSEFDNNGIDVEFIRLEKKQKELSNVYTSI